MEVGYRTWVASQLEKSDGKSQTFVLATQWSNMTAVEKKIFQDREVLSARIVSLTCQEKALRQSSTSTQSADTKEDACPSLQSTEDQHRKVSKGVFNFQGGNLELGEIRSVLIRLEESIIFGLIERAQFAINSKVYIPGALGLPNQSFLEYVLYGTEAFHSTIRRYTSPDEHPFSVKEGLPKPILPALDFPQTVLPTPKICQNSEILRMYIDDIIPAICTEGDDQNYGSSAILDVSNLQLLSKRIHYGKFVAEIKFREHPEEFGEAIAKRDVETLSKYITKPVVEEMVLKRVRDKAVMYGTGLSMDEKPVISPELLSNLYLKIIKLTKVVEIDYLLSRLDADNV